MGKVAPAQVRPRTLVFVIFKECVTESRGVSQPFIAYEMPDSTSQFDNRAEMQSLDDLLKFFAYEHFTPVYDPANLHGSHPSSPQPDIKTNRPQLFSRRLALQTKMKKMGFADIHDIESDTRKCTFSNQDVSDTLLGQMHARKLRGDAVVLLHFGGFTRKDSVITITDTYTGNDATLDVATDIPQLHKWFSLNRKPQRKYTFNPKHGDISKKCRAGFAQLETSEADTTTLLKLAVGIDHRSPLWYHDAARGKYIYFENQQETPPNFHGYHVKQGEKNYENIDIDKLRMVQNIP